MSSNTVRIGTRGSDLAIRQTEIVCRAIKEKLGLQTETIIISTSGDRDQEHSFEQMEGIGFFSSELEQALLTGKADLAVHSLKDLPTTQPAELTIAALGFRADPADLLLAREIEPGSKGLIPLREGSTVGTSSARRKAQLWKHNSSVVLKELRGNVPTRIEKLRAGQYDAILIASAGVSRLNLDLEDLAVIRLEPRQFLPAPGQGILALQARQLDTDLISELSKLGDHQATVAAKLERGLLTRFDSGCSLPLGTYSEVPDGRYYMKACLGLRNAAGKWSSTRTKESSGESIERVVDELYSALNRD